MGWWMLFGWVLFWGTVSGTVWGAVCMSGAGAGAALGCCWGCCFEVLVTVRAHVLFVVSQLWRQHEAVRSIMMLSIEPIRTLLLL